MYIYTMFPMLIILFHSERSIPITRDNAAELLIPFGALVAAVIWLGIYLRRKAIARIKPVAEHYGGEAYCTFLGETVMTGAYKNNPFEIRSCDNSRNMYFRIKMAADCGFFLEVYREAPLKTLAKGTGLLADFDSGDPLFDAEFDIKTDNAELSRRFLSDDTIRRRIWELMNAGYRSVKIIKSGETILGLIKLERGDFDPETEFTFERVTWLLETMALLGARAVSP